MNSVIKNLDKVDQTVKLQFVDLPPTCAHWRAMPPWMSACTLAVAMVLPI
ncbi:MAG: hypothetical protein GY954_15900 [Alteromonas sp.]|nr:hypothetical protein [Alteromonas sp.]